MSINLHGVYSLPVPLHLDLDRCGNGCKYCFVKSDKGTSIRQVENAINKKYDGSIKSFYLSERYPICISNVSDVFNCKDNDVVYTLIKILKSAGFPIYLQTKGVHTRKQMDFMLDELDSTDVIYVTLTGLNENLSEMETQAPTGKARLEMIDELVENGYRVDIGFNPILREYISQEEIIAVVEKYKNNPRVTYCFDPIHRINNKMPGAKYINKLVELNKIGIDDWVKPIQDYLFANPGVAVDGWIGEKRRYVWNALKSSTVVLRGHFGKKIPLGRDIADACKQYYDECQVAGKDIDNGYVDYQLDVPYIINYMKQFIPEGLVIKKSEIRSKENYLLKSLPEIIKYEDYLALSANYIHQVGGAFSYSYSYYYTDKGNSPVHPYMFSKYFKRKFFKGVFDEEKT